MSYSPSSERYNAMQYRSSGRSGLKLPAISLGLWHNFGHDTAPERSRKMLFTAFDLGITHFDLANNYGPPPGSAEEFFGDRDAVRLQAVSRRDGHLLQGRLGHVARTLWRRRQPQIPARQPRPELASG